MHLKNEKFAFFFIHFYFECGRLWISAILTEDPFLYRCEILWNLVGFLILKDLKHFVIWKTS